MHNNYLLECEDSLTIQRKEQELIKKTDFEEGYQTIYDLEEVSLSLALEDLDTYSFLSSKKVIIIRNAFKDALEKELKHLEKYIESPNPNHLLLISSKKFDHRTTWIKNLKKNKNISYLKLEIEPEKIIEEKLKGYQIEKSDITYFVEKCKKDVTKISNECDKLAIYKLEDKKITREDIDLLVVEKLGDSSDILYSMVNAIIKKEKRIALKNYKELEKYQMDAYSILGLLASQIRLIHQIKLLKEKNMSNQEIADTLKLKSVYQVKKISEYALYYTKKEIYELTKTSSL